MLIVAFGHRKRTGKDTAAKLLFAHLKRLQPSLRVERVSFAGKLKEVAYDLFKWGGLQPAEFYDSDEFAGRREVELPQIGKTPRQIWIEVGSLMRQIHPDVWIKNALYAFADVLIVSDLRYLNEAEEIARRGGLRYKVVRDSAPVSNDVADSALEGYTGWTDVIYNNGSLEELDAKMLEIAKEITREDVTTRNPTR